MDRGNGWVREAGNSIERFLASLDGNRDALRAELLGEGVEVGSGNKDFRFRTSDNQALQTFF